VGPGLQDPPQDILGDLLIGVVPEASPLEEEPHGLFGVVAAGFGVGAVV